MVFGHVILELGDRAAEIQPHVPDRTVPLFGDADLRQVLRGVAPLLPAVVSLVEFQVILVRLLLRLGPAGQLVEGPEVDAALADLRDRILGRYGSR